MTMSTPISNWPAEAIKLDEAVPEPGEGKAWIQWKNTNVCMDVHCRCGHHGHVDAEFAYFYRCPECLTVFAVGQTVRLYELTGKALEDARAGSCLKTDGEDADGSGAVH